MTIKTGKGTITLMALLAIWSISLVVNLPGLAISPMMANLTKIFPNASELEIQLLTVLPNLLIIPFVLFSGKLSEGGHQITIVKWGLLIFLVAAVLYFFCRSMLALILVSCLLGIGCGLVIPLAAGLIADTFVGKYRMKQLGIKSAISNIALVIATFVVGWLNHGNWHLPFVVYLMAAVPLFFIFFLKREHSDLKQHIQATTQASSPNASSAPDWAKPQPGEKIKDGFILSRIWPLLGFYAFATYSCLILSDYLPFLVEERHLSSDITGTATALFFLAIFLPGLLLPSVCKLFKGYTVFVAFVAIVVGLGLMVIAHSAFLICVAGVLMGAGYGACQPIIYDKATYTVTSDKKATMALAIVLAVNYITIAITPYIVDAFHLIFSKTNPNTFAFALNFFLSIGFTVIALLFRNKFTFKIAPIYYS